MSEPDDHPESLRDGRYAVCGVLGEGSQAATLEAVDKQRGEPVAIKRFLVRGARSWKDVELAEREARVLSGVQHRLLPKAVEHFEEDGALYLVMEKVEGQALSSLGALSQQEVIHFLHDASEVLEYLHGRAPPIIHRDVKPGNVIRRPPRPELGEEHASYVLVDFGSVRDSLKPAGGSTVVGTFGYMAPEQFQGRALPASDVYAVGATALRLLTGLEPEKLPHKGLAIDVRAALGSSCSPQLVAAIEAMVEPDPDRRAPRVGPLLSALPRQRRDAPPEEARHAVASGRDGRHAARRRARREQHDARRAARADRRVRDGATHPVGGVFPAVVMFAMAIARIAVALSLLVLVPTLLTVLSIVLGAPLRRAARQVQRAGERADRRIVETRDRALGRRPEEDVAAAPPAAPGPRIEQPPSRARIEGKPKKGSVVDDAISEIEAAVEEAVEEVKRELEPKRRRRK